MGLISSLLFGRNNRAALANLHPLDVFSKPNKLKARMLAAAAWGELLSKNARDFMGRAVAWIVGYFVNSGSRHFLTWAKFFRHSNLLVAGNSYLWRLGMSSIISPFKSCTEPKPSCRGRSVGIRLEARAEGSPRFHCERSGSYAMKAGDWRGASGAERPIHRDAPVVLLGSQRAGPRRQAFLYGSCADGEPQWSGGRRAGDAGEWAPAKARKRCSALCLLKKLLEFSDFGMLQLFEIERLLIDQMIPFDRDVRGQGL